MGWKIYFWAIATVTVLSLLGYTAMRHVTIRDYVDIGSAVIDIVGIFAYVYKKTIATPQFWKWYFWISVIVISFDFLYLYSGLIILPSYLLSHGVEMSRSTYGFGTILAIPYYYALYELGYGSTKKAPKKKK